MGSCGCTEQHGCWDRVNVKVFWSEFSFRCFFWCPQSFNYNRKFMMGKNMAVIIVQINHYPWELVLPTGGLMENTSVHGTLEAVFLPLYHTSSIEFYSSIWLLLKNQINFNSGSVECVNKCSLQSARFSATQQGLKEAIRTGSTLGWAPFDDSNVLCSWTLVVS
jgi:hypothetical protein